MQKPMARRSLIELVSCAFFQLSTCCGLGLREAPAATAHSDQAQPSNLGRRLRHMLKPMSIIDLVAFTVYPASADAGFDLRFCAFFGYFGV